MKISIKKINLLIIFALLFHFIFLIAYAIPIVHIIALYTIVSYVIFYKKNKIKIRISNDIFWFFLFGALFVIYSWIVVQINGSAEGSFIYTIFLRYFMYLLVVALWAEMLVYKYNLSKEKFNDLIIYILFLQVICVYLSAFVPSFYSFTRSVLPDMGNIINSSNINLQLRFKGFSNSGGDGLSLILSICPMLCFLEYKLALSTFSKWKYLIMFWLSFFSLIFVGRTGIIVVVLFLGFNLIVYYRTIFIFMFRSTLLMLPLFLISIGFLQEILGDRFNAIIDFAFEFFNGKSGSTDDLFGNMLFLPNTWKTLLFGDGMFANGDGTNYMQSDSGYVRLIFFFGIIGSALFYLVNVVFIKKFINLSSKDTKIMFYNMLIMYFIVEIKRPFILGNGYTTVYLFLLFFQYFHSQRLNNQIV